MPPPPPPPPPPMPGFGSGGPPPPPPPGGLPKPPAAATKGRGALLGDIEKGRKLKKVTQINDRSAPIVSNANKAAAAPVMGAPPIPGMAKAPGGLAPPVPGVAAANRARSSSDVAGGSAGDSAMAAAPQLGGLFAAGMPKLRKSGGVRTGADGDSPYLSDPEHSRSPHAPKPPAMSAPKPPGAPRPPGSAPPMPPPNPAVSALKGGLRPFPSSSASTPDFHAKPKPPPVGKKPPIPPPTSRKPSMPQPRSASPLPFTAPPPPPTSSSPAPPAPPPPPPSAAPRPPAPPTNRSAPPPPSSAPPLPMSAPPPPVTNAGPSLAAQAARNAFGRSSPAAPPPPPPPAPQATPPASPAPPPPPVSAPSPPSMAPRAHTQPPLRSMLDPSSYTLTNGGPQSPTPSRGDGGGPRGFVIITDTRFKFQPEHELPKPRNFEGGSKRYRAGRGSTVPLDLSAYD